MYVLEPLGAVGDRGLVTPVYPRPFVFLTFVSLHFYLFGLFSFVLAEDFPGV